MAARATRSSLDDLELRTPRWQASRERSSGAKTDELVIDYAFGSGHHAVSSSADDKDGTH